MKRLESTGLKKVVIGISGGLDSTQAALVAVRAFDRLGLPRGNVLGYTLPGFGTTRRTYDNARRLMAALGMSAAEIDIRPAAERMLKDIGHPFARGKPTYDVTFENVQAGERTSHLFRLANLHGGLVLGTGDLSELALGFTTYGVGDHMSHYNVNASVPKTLIQHLIRWLVRTRQFDDATLAVARPHRRRRASRPSWCPVRSDAPDAVVRGRGRTVRAAGFQSLLPEPLRVPAEQGRFPRLECLARPQGAASGRTRSRSPSVASTTCRRSAAGSRCSCCASSRPASSSAPPCPTGRKSARAARCRREATGARRAIRQPRSGLPSCAKMYRPGTPRRRRR